MVASWDTPFGINGWLPEPPELEPLSLKQPLDVEAVSGLDDFEVRDIDLLNELFNVVEWF